MTDNSELIRLLTPRLRAYPNHRIFNNPEGVGVVAPHAFHFSILCYPNSFTLSWLYQDDAADSIEFQEFTDLNSLFFYLDREFFPIEEIGR